MNDIHDFQIIAIMDMDLPVLTADTRQRKLFFLSVFPDDADLGLLPTDYTIKSK